MLPIAMGTPEIAIIVLVIVVLFGIKRLPEFGKSLAEAIQEFRKATRKTTEEDKPAETEPKNEPPGQQPS